MNNKTSKIRFIALMILVVSLVFASMININQDKAEAESDAVYNATSATISGSGSTFTLSNLGTQQGNAYYTKLNVDTNGFSITEGSGSIDNGSGELRDNNGTNNNSWVRFATRINMGGELKSFLDNGGELRLSVYSYYYSQVHSSWSLGTKYWRDGLGLSVSETSLNAGFSTGQPSSTNICNTLNSSGGSDGGTRQGWVTYYNAHTLNSSNSNNSFVSYAGIQMRASQRTASFSKFIVKVEIVNKIDFNMSGASWSHSSPYQYDRTQKTVSLTGLPGGVSVASYSGNSATNAGNYTASATFNYNTVLYNAPSVASLPWSITPRPITVTANSASKIYGDPDPAFGYQVTSGSIISGDTLTGTLSRNSGETVGGYPITQGSLNNSNYGITFVSDNLTITPRPITVTADNKSKTYGEVDPALTYSITQGNLVFGDTLSGILSRDVGEIVGQYPIKQNDLSANANYTLTFVEGTLTIDKASYNMSGASWSHSSPYTYDGTEKTITVVNLPSGVFVESYTGNSSTNAGDYTASVTLDHNDHHNYHTPTMANLSWQIFKATFDMVGTSWDYVEAFVYDRTEKSVSVINLPANLSINNYFNNSYTNAGDYIASVVFSYDTDNYNAPIWSPLNWSINPRAIELTADDNSKTYGDDDPELTYQLTDGNIISGDVLTGSIVRAEGENVNGYSITQGTLDNTNYAITFIDGTFSINPRPITLEADDKSKIYGDDDPVLTYQITLGELVNGDVLTGSIIRAEGENFGNYDITQGTLDNSNYDITFIDGTFTINKRDITITADDKTREYGDVDPALTYQFVGELQFSDEFSGELARVVGEAVDDYTINQGTININANYNIIYNAGTFTITKRVLNIFADAKTRIYGDTDSAFTYTFNDDRLIGGDTLTVVLTRETGENIGDYEIVTTTLEASEDYYQLNYTSEFMTITRRALTVTFDDYSGLEYTSDVQSITVILNTSNIVFSDTVNAFLTYDPEIVVNIGDYTATANVDNNNYYLEGVITQEFSISRVNAIVAFSDYSGLIYNGQIQSINAYVTNLLINDIGQVNVTLDYDVDPKNVGSYVATAVALDSDNYVLSGVLTQGFSISPKPITVTFSNYNLIYNGEVQTITATANSVEAGDTVEVLLNYGGDEVKYVGSYSATASISELNYVLTGNVLRSFSIAPKPISVVFDNYDGIIYDGTVQTINGALQGVAPEDTVNLTLNYSAPAVDAGNYTVVAEIDNFNYTLINSTRLFTVNPKPVTIIFTGFNGLIYNGEEQSISANVNPVEIIGVDEINVNLVYNDTVINAGAYIAAATLDNSNYTISGAFSKVFMIAQRAVTVSFGNFTGIIYDGTPKAITASINQDNVISGDTVDAVLTYSETPLNAGNYAAYAAVDNNNYYITGNSIQGFAIHARALTVSFSGFNGLIYDGNVREISVALDTANILPEDTVNVGLTYDRTVIDAGDYVATAYIDNNNYILVGVFSRDFTIETKAITVEYSNYQGLIYNSDVQTIDVQAFGVVGGDDSGLYLDYDKVVYDADTYLATAIITNANYHLEGIITQSFVIVPYEITVLFSNYEGLVYSRSEQFIDVEAQGVFLGDTTGLYLDYSEYVFDAGNYTANAFITNDNYVLTGITEQAFTISPKDITVEFSDYELTYNGEEQVIGYAAVGVIAGDDAGLYLVYEDSTVKLAGDYLATAYITNANYQLTGILTQEFTIAQREVTVSFSNYNLIYNSFIQTIDATISGEVEGEDVGLFLTYNKEVKYVTNDYVATANIENPNYKLAGEITQEFEVTPFGIAITFINYQGLVYNGGEQEISAIYNLMDIFIGDIVNIILDYDRLVLDAGTYTAYALLDNPNYYIDSDSEQEFTIAQKEISVIFRNYSNLVYDGSVQEIDAILNSSDIVNGDTIILTITYNDEVKDVGNYTAFAAIDNNNYIISSATEQSFTISPKSITVVFSDYEDLIYNADVQTITAVLDQDAIVEGDVVNVSLGYDKLVKNADTYLTTALLDNSNYELVGIFTQSFVISPKSITVTFSQYLNMVYNGGVQTIVVQANGVLNDDDTGLYLDYDKQVKNADDYIATAVITNSNYVLTGVIEQEFTIIPLDITVEFSNWTNLVFNGEIQTIDVTAIGVLGLDETGLHLVYDKTVRNVDTYLATAYISNGNYNLIETITQEFNISPKELTVEFSAFEGLIYNGGEQTIGVSALGLVDGEASGLYLEYDKQVVNADTYTATAFITNNNYVLVYSIEQEFIISPKSITVAFSNHNNLVYNRNIQTIDVVANGVVNDDDTGLYIEYDKQVFDADSYLATAVITNTNYILVEPITQAFDIAPKSITVTFSNYSGKIYTGFTQTINVVANNVEEGDTTGIYLEYDGVVKNVGSYMATAHITNDNYVLDGTITQGFSIAPKNIFVQSDAKTKTYGFNDPVLTYMAFGLVGLPQDNVFTGSLSRVAGEQAGSYQITQGTLALNDNYIINYTPSNLTILRRQLTVTAVDMSKVYGYEDPSFEFDYTGQFIGNDGFNGALGREVGQDIGTYIIDQGTLTAGNNYDITFTGAVFTINSRAITISAIATGKVYGNADPALEYEVTVGALAYDDVLPGSLVRVAGEDIGKYDILQGTIYDDNYIITYISAKFSVYIREITIIADAKSKVYGEADPELTYQIIDGELAEGDELQGNIVRAMGEEAGTYIISKGTLAYNNYMINFVEADFVITLRPITIVAQSYIKVYGEDDPIFEYGITEGSLAFDEEISGNIERIDSESFGVYFITQGTLAVNDNYDITYIEGTLTINKRNITITANSKTKIYGEADPELDFALTSGELAFDDEFSGSLVRQLGNNAGLFIINQGTVSVNGNYVITYVPNSFTITKRLITIEADAKTITYGDDNLALSYQITSGNLVGADSLTGNIVRESGDGAGQYLISQGTLNNNNYNIIFVEALYTIEQLAIRLQAEDKSQVYGDVEEDLTYNIIEGSLINDDELSGSIARDSGLNVGIYVIHQGTLDNANYMITFDNAEYTITQRPITIEADSKTMVYGNSEPVLTYTLTEGNIVSGDILYGELVREEGISVGQYNITQGALDNANYDISFVEGVFNISVRSITLRADAKTKVYGDADPELTFSVTQGSIANQDTFSGSMTRVAGEGIGNYRINRGTLNNSNYLITFVTSDLTIIKRDITVMADSITVFYGDSDHALSFSLIEGNLVGDDELYGNMIREEGLNVGDYSIQKGTLNNPNYNITFVEDLYVIIPKPITVEANPIAITYGDNETELTFEVEGLVGDDVLYGNIIREDGSAAGSYLISQGTLANANYSITFVPAYYTINPKSVTVVADAITITYGDNETELTFDVNGVLTGDEFTGSLAREANNNVGSYLISIGTLDNTNYAITFVPAYYTINAKAITVTADDITVTYGDDEAELTYNIDGILTGDELTGSLARESGNDVGSYLISIGTLDNANYDITFESAYYTINAKAITVTADEITITYGDDEAELTYIANGLVTGDVLAGSLEREVGNDVGSYLVSQGTLSNANYVITFESAYYTINAKAITVTADEITIIYGDNDVELTYIANGLVTGDELGGSLEREVGNDVGSYLISIGTLDNANYAITFESAYYTINAKAITVTADEITIIYGDDEAELTYEVEGLLTGDELTGSLEREAGNDVGTYLISIGTLDNANYAITFESAYYTINAKVITVTADSITISYGDESELTFEVEGLLTGDELTGSLAREAGNDVGTYLISIGTLDNANYAITFEPAYFTINAKAITVTADAITITYGDEAELTYEVEGLVTGDELSGSLAREAGNDIGSYLISIGTLSNANYSITFESAYYTINAKPLTVQADDINVVYGDDEPILTFIVSGLIYGDTLTGALEREAGNDVGVYEILLGTLDNANYDITFEAASYTINARSITVTADNITIAYGSKEPTLTYTISGQLIGDDSVSGSLAREAGNNVGNYLITQGTLSLSGNYAVSFIDGLMIIDPREITVTADSKAKVYGNPDPSLTYTITNGSVVGSDVLTGQLSRASGENVGSYAIGLGTLMNANYGIVFISANLSISPRAITITADAKTKLYNSQDPELTYSITSGNLVGQDSLSGSLARQSGEELGSYQITQGTLTAGGNYNINYVAANLSVTPHNSRDITNVISPVMSSVDNNNITATVASSITSLTVNVEVSPYAIWQLYSDAQCTQIIENKEMTIAGGSNTVYIKVAAQDGISSRVYNLTITRAASQDRQIIVPDDTQLKDVVVGDNQINANVAPSVDTYVIDIGVSENATFKVFRDSSLSEEITDGQLALNSGQNTVFIVVIAEDGSETIYTMNVYKPDQPMDFSLIYILVAIFGGLLLLGGSAFVVLRRR